MRKTVKDIIMMKKDGEQIAMLTAYDAPMASLLHDSGADILLVGDSLGMVVLGYDSTVPVTMADMLHHSAAVRRGAPEALVVTDMPFGSCHVSEAESITNGYRLMKEAGCDAVKIEGGKPICPTIKRMVDAGIPVMGHLGLTPQTAGSLGGYKVQGRDIEAAKRLLEDALALQEAGTFGIVLECVPTGLAEIVSKKLEIPTIGIGAGDGCDGQVLVTNDMLGLFEKFVPKFVKHFAELAPQIREGVEKYIKEVRTGTFPAKEHQFSSNCDYRELLE